MCTNIVAVVVRPCEPRTAHVYPFPRGMRVRRGHTGDETRFSRTGRDFSPAAIDVDRCARGPGKHRCFYNRVFLRSPARRGVVVVGGGGGGGGDSVEPGRAPGRMVGGRR